MPDTFYRERQRNLVQQVRKEGCDAVLVCSRGTLRWLCGFSGSNGALLLTESGSWFFTDGRYGGEAQGLVSSGAASAVGIVSSALPAAVFGLPDFSGAIRDITEAAGHSARIAVEADHVTVASHEAMLAAVSEHACACRLCPLSGLAEALRAIKGVAERDAMTRALRLTESVFLDVLTLVQEGVSENDLAAEIDFRQKRAGASRSSFEPIVAFGRNSARPHARPGPDRLAPATPILFDFGCELDGYCSDMTRMACLGRPPPEFMRIWSVVNAAREAAVEAAVAGMSTLVLDQTARRVIEEEGHGEHFVHSLGHGLGIDVHEWPSVSHRAAHILQEHMVVTIEPGIYLEGRFGIRLEDTIVITGAHCERLNRLSTETVIL